jgi:glycosyltransferase involved in cell wall biosynthesis
VDIEATIWTIRSGWLVACDPHEAASERRIVPAAWDWRCWQALDQVIAVEQPDIIHIQYQSGAYAMHPAINLYPQRIRRRAKRPRIFATFHDLLMPYLFPKAGPVRRWVTKRLLKDVDRAIVTNSDDWTAVIGSAPADPSGLRFRGVAGQIPAPAVIPIGANIEASPPPNYQREQWRQAQGYTSDDLVLAFFGLISASKGLDTLIDALSFIPSDLRVRVVIIGGAAPAAQDHAYAAQIRERVAHLPAGIVQITGHSPPAEVSAHLLAADLVVLPFRDGASYRRGSLLAALAHGIATITTSPPATITIPTAFDSSDRPDLPTLQHDQHVHLVPPDQPQALADAIVALAHDPSARTRLGLTAAELARQFSWDTIAARHLHLYRKNL